MKTIKTLLLSSIVAATTIATAVEKPKMNVVPLTADRAIVSITNENAAYFELSIETENGESVYYKQSNEPLTKYQKTYDFANLETGTYIFSVKVNDTKLKKKFEVSHNNIAVGEQELRFDPYFAFENNELKFSYLNFDQENINMNIYNDGTLVYQKKLGSDFNLSKGFDLSKLEAGNYRVVLSSRSNDYDFSLVK